MEKPQVFIVMGRSGSGKGTQIALLQAYLKEKTPTIAQQNFVCGDRFREFFKTESPISQIVKESVNAGNYQPDFFATTLYFSEIFKTINSSDHLIFDGYPRSLIQLEDLKKLLTYIGRTHAIVIDISVTGEEVVRRIMLRTGRTDDSKEGAEKRQQEFDRSVVPVIEAVKADPFFTYLEIDGMPLPADVHHNVVQALNSVHTS
jgi:adenylate kinase